MKIISPELWIEIEKLLPLKTSKNINQIIDGLLKERWISCLDIQD